MGKAILDFVVGSSIGGALALIVALAANAVGVVSMSGVTAVTFTCVISGVSFLLGARLPHQEAAQ